MAADTQNGGSGKTKTGAGSGASSTAAQKPKSGLFYFLSLLAAFAVCGLFPATTLLIAACMTPTAVVYLLDIHPRRHATKTIAWANFAGAMIVTFDLWQSERSLDTAFDIMMSPFTWATVLCAASVGWVIQFIVPRLVMGYLDISQKVQEKDLIKKQKALEKEWGTIVREEAPLEELETIRAEVKAKKESAKKEEVEADQQASDENEEAAR